MGCEHDGEGPRTAGLCGRCSPTERNRYFRGKLLTVSDYQTEQGYMIGRRRLINRAMLGWGVITGFTLRQESGILNISRGVGLDRAGRELLACDAVEISGPKDVIWLKRGDCGYDAGEPPSGEQPPSQAGNGTPDQPPRKESQPPLEKDGARPGGRGRLCLLRAHYAEVPVDGIRVDDGCGAATCEANHLCETVVYSLEPIHECPSGLPGCSRPDGRCEGEGGRDPSLPPGAEDKLSRKEREQRQQAQAAAKGEAAEPQQEGREGDNVPRPGDGARPRPQPGGDDHGDLPLLPLARVHDRGPQERLCLWSEAWPVGLDPCGRDRLQKVGCLWADLDSGVPLACVIVAPDRCGDPVIVGVSDSCRPRRLARPNETLFDLVRGCDLTRIVDIGWRRWHEEDEGVDFHEFRDMFEPPRAAAEPSDYDVPGPSLTRFWVQTSGPVRIDSLTPDIFTIRVLHGDDDEGYHSVSRIMIDNVFHDGTYAGDPPGTTRRFRPAVSGYFYNGELQRGQRAKFRNEVVVEITLDGDRVIDGAGQCLDANRRGRDLPTGNGAPGGLFTSEFTVRPGYRRNERPAPQIDQGEAR